MVSADGSFLKLIKGVYIGMTTMRGRKNSGANQRPTTQKNT